MNTDSRPLLILLGQALPNRVAAFEHLAQKMPIEMVDLAGDVPHGGGLAQIPDSVPHLEAGLRDIPRLIRSGNYRAVMIETQGPATFSLAAWVARRARVPLVIWMGLQEVPRTPRWIIGKQILHRALRWSDVVISYGSAQAELAWSLGARRVVASVDPIDLDFWSAPIRGESNDPTVAPRFLFAGRRELEKGPHVLIEAWNRSGLAQRGSTLTMVGSGDWKPRGGFPAGVEVQGSLPREEVRDVYAASDVLVVPSITTRTFKEPWGMVVSEAMAQGVAVIASDSVGAVASGLAVDGETALVIPERDAEALAEAMQHLADDTDLRERLVAAGRERVRRFGPARWANDMLAAVDSIPYRPSSEVSR